MNAIFWLGLILGGVVGLGVDLWKRPLDRLLDRRLRARTSTRAGKLSKRLENDRQSLRDFLMVQILETTLVGSSAGAGRGRRCVTPRGTSCRGPLGHLLRCGADARLPPDLRHAGPQRVTERAALRLVIEHGYGHEDDHARTRRFSVVPWESCGSRVQQPHRPPTTKYDRHRPLSCLNDLYRPPWP